MLNLATSYIVDALVGVPDVDVVAGQTCFAGVKRHFSLLDLHIYAVWAVTAVVGDIVWLHIPVQSEQ